MSEQAESEPVTFSVILELPGYRFGSDGSIQSRWVRGSKRHRLAEHWHEVKSRRNKIRDYLYVTLTTPEGRKHLRVNVLILWAFTGHRPEGMEAAHKDGNRLDNRIGNLEWKTHAQNIADKVAHGTLHMGQQIKQCKLSPPQVYEIRGRAAGGEGFAVLGRAYGMSEATIRAIHYRRNWKHLPEDPS